MRKVLSFVLVLSLVLGSFSMAFAAAPKDVVGEPSEDAVTVLSDLGVVSGYEDGTYKPENIVTRAEMAVLVIRALGLSDYVTGTAKSSFKDMAGYGWAEGYIAYAQSLGFVSGYPDGTFKPGQTVSYDEAASMLVRALGHTTDSLTGTWPANFVVKAKSLGILDGIKSGTAGANRGDVAIMLYQTLDQKIGTVNKDGDFVETNSGTVLVPVYDTMLARLGAEDYDQNGTIPAADKGKFVVNGNEDSIINLNPYVGAVVTAYQNKDGEIIAIKSVESTFLTGEYKVADDVLAVNGTNYALDAATLSTLTGVGNFLNGGDNTTTLAAPSVNNQVYTIAADVSGKKVKEIYSVSIWDLDNGAAFQWDADYETELEDEQSLENIDFALTDDDEIDHQSYALFGADSLDKIAKDSVVYVYEGSVDGDDIVTRIEVGTATVSGEITKVNSTQDTFTIDGKAYSLGAGWSGTVPQAGDEVKFILDYAGEIYDVDKISGSIDKIAVVLETKDGGAGSIDGGNAKIALALADGTNKVFEADAKAIADTTIISAAKAWTSTGAMQTGGLIKYSVDKNGVIDGIKALAEVDKTGGTVSITKNGYFDGAKIKSDAVIFVYDSSATPAITALAGAVLDGDDFDVTTLEKVLDTDVLAYYVKNNSGVIEAMIIDDSAIAGDEVYGLITANGTNSSDAGKYLDMLIDGKAVSYNTKSSETNKLIVYAVTFDTNGNAVLAPVDSTNAVTGSAVDAGTSGFALSVNSNNVVTVNTSTAGITTTGAFNVTTGFTLDSNVKVYVQNSAGTRYVVGKVSDLKSDELQSVVFYDLGSTSDRDGIVDLVLVVKH